MTECDRIIEQGILPKSFFEPETICDFYVDEKRKKIWAVELDLLLEFDRVCKKHNLQYFLMYGSLLGAIRHKGFIPWDDDMDVVMPREDYDVFLSLNEEFLHPYFLQTVYSDKEYWYSYVKIRNSNTTGICKKFSYNPYNHGIFIDVFPLDKVNSMYTIDCFEKVKSLILENSTYMKSNNPNLDSVDKERVINHLGLDPLCVYNEINRIATSFSKDLSCNLVSTVLLPLYPYHKSVYNSKDFDSAIYCNLYGLQLPVPIGYDNILTKLYGDYMKYPPVSERGQWHDDILFDPDNDYKTSMSLLHKNE